jgi:hypothetical protein
MALHAAADGGEATAEAAWVTGRWLDTTGAGEDRTLERFGWLFEVPKAPRPSSRLESESRVEWANTT